MGKLRAFRVGIGVVCAALILFAVGCTPAAGGSTGGDTPQTASLSDQVVDELIASLQSANVTSSNGSIRAIAADKLTSIKAKILDAIKADGLSSSAELDKILPSMIKGLDSAIASDTSFSDAAKVTIYTVTTKSALASLGTDARKSKLSSGTTVSSTVGTIAATSVKVVTASITTVTVASEAVSSIAKETVSTVSTNTVYSTNISGTVNLVVKDSIAALESSASVNAAMMTSSVSALVKGSVAGAIESSSSAADIKAVVSVVNTGAASASANVTKITSTEVVSLSVTASVSEVASSTSTIISTSNAKSELVQATVSSALSSATAESASNLATEVVKATTTAVVASGSTDTSMVTAAAAQVTASAAAVGVTVSASDITTAVSTVSGAGSVVDTNAITATVAAVQSETPPTITAASASPEIVTAKNTAVTLSVTAAAGTVPDKTSSLAYAWTQVSGPSVAISNAATESATVTIVSTGEYKFMVTVSNSAGYKSVYALVTTTANIPSTESKTAVEEGIASLAKKDFDMAYTKFKAAYTADTTNTDAAFWYSIMNIAAISTNSDTVTLLKDKIGFTSYPSTMNELFSATWLNSNWYGTKFGFVPYSVDSAKYGVYIRGNIAESASGSSISVYDSNQNWASWSSATFTASATGSYYRWAYNVNGSYYYNYSENQLAPTDTTLWYTMGSMLDPSNAIKMPNLELPTWASTYFSANTTSGVSSSNRPMYAYPAVLMLNIISRNPGGLNTLLDSALSSVFGDQLTASIAIIDSLPDAATITVPASLLSAYTSKTVPSAGVTVPKAALLLAVAELQASKSMVQLLASYNLDYDITFLQNEMWTDKGSSAAMSKLLSGTNPIKAGVLANRSDTMRASARATMLSAISHVQTACDSYAVNIDAILSANAEILPSDVTTIKSKLDSIYATTKSAASMLYSAINNDTALYINSSALYGGSMKDVVSTVSSDGAIKVNPAVLYTTDILNPAKLFEINGTDAAPTGLKIYAADFSSGTPVITAVTEKITSVSPYSLLGFKVNTDRAKLLIDSPTVVDEYSFLPVYLITKSISVSDFQMSVLNWMQGF